jgi:hypothetical protein
MHIVVHARGSQRFLGPCSPPRLQRTLTPLTAGLISLAASNAREPPSQQPIGGLYHIDTVPDLKVQRWSMLRPDIIRGHCKPGRYLFGEDSAPTEQEPLGGGPSTVVCRSKPKMADDEPSSPLRKRVPQWQERQAHSRDKGLDVSKESGLCGMLCEMVLKEAKKCSYLDSNQGFWIQSPE